MPTKVMAYLLIISLIGSLLAPSLASAIGSESRVLLCTSQGYQWVSIEEEQELKLTDNVSSMEHCLYCLGTDDDHEQIVFTYSYLDLVPTDYVARSLQEPNLTKFLITSVLQPRAPPFFI